MNSNLFKYKIYPYTVVSSDILSDIVTYPSISNNLENKEDNYDEINIFNSASNTISNTIPNDKLQIQSTYNQIAKQFSQTRYKMWPGVKNFLLSLPEKYYILDAGCGNGKNMLETKHKFYGIDLSDELLKEAMKKTVDKTNIIGFVQGSIIKMNTIKNDSFDAVISIAVIHHLETQNERVTAIKEMIRVCKNGGVILFTVWKLEDNDVYEKGKTISEDTHNKLIMWKDVKNGMSYDRFYHFFTYEEIFSLIKEITNDLINSSANFTVFPNFTSSAKIQSKEIDRCQITEEANNYYVKLYLT